MKTLVEGSVIKYYGIRHKVVEYHGNNIYSIILLDDTDNEIGEQFTITYSPTEHL
jgi:hypothetical protein